VVRGDGGGERAPGRDLAGEPGGRGMRAYYPDLCRARLERDRCGAWVVAAVAAHPARLRVRQRQLDSDSFQSRGDFTLRAGRLYDHAAILRLCVGRILKNRSRFRLRMCSISIPFRLVMSKEWWRSI